MAASNQTQQDSNITHLRELESYVAALESFISEPIALVNPNGVIADVNRSFANFFGTTQSFLVGHKFADLIVGENPLAQLQGKDGNSGNDLFVADKVVFQIEQTSHPARLQIQRWHSQSGELQGYILGAEQIQQVDEDTSNQTKKTDQAPPLAPEKDGENGALIDQVKEQEMRAQSVLYNITDGLIFFDSDRTVDMVNPSAARMLDTNASELIGKHIDELKNNKVIKELRKLLLEGEKLSKKELSIGAEAYFEVTTIDIGDKEGRSQQVVILDDISEKRKIEEMKLEFASVAAHQMRTPLSSIRWSFEILSKKLEDEELLKAAERGYKSTEQVLEVVDELLNVDRLEEGDSGYTFDSIDLVEMLDDLVETEQETKAVLDQPDIDFEKPVDHIPNVRGDETKLKIVFKNLLDNALKYTDSDAEVKIRVNIKMTSGYGGDVVIAEIEDEGIGIPKESQDKVFSKFYRADNATDMETEGTGVGLFITKEIVEAHNGKIWFDSTPGEGTTFYVQLPMASDN